MGHHALARSYLSMGWDLANGESEQMEERGEWLERDGFQGTHMGRVMVGK